MQRLLRRQDFLAAARGRSRASHGAVVQLRRREDEGAPRVGFTVTSKLGGAVQRNRIRRRLREAVRLGARDHFRNGYDYVIVGRAATTQRAFANLISDIISAVDYLHGPEAQVRSPGARRHGQDSL